MCAGLFVLTFVAGMMALIAAVGSTRRRAALAAALTAMKVERRWTAKLIEQYAAGGEKLSLAIRGLTREDLLAVPAPTPTSDVVDPAGRDPPVDSDLIAADRMKRMIAEDNPR